MARIGLAGLLRRYPRVMLLAPHPDDETLALGATLVDMAQTAEAVTVVIATHGGVNGSPQRRDEGERAMAVLGDHIATVWWDLPDGSLGDFIGDMVVRLDDMVDDRTLLLAPFERDGHADHEAVTEAAEAVVRSHSAALLLYPVWLWHWATPDDVDFSRMRSIAPSLQALTTKRRALGCYTSQLQSADGHPIVGTALRRRAHRVMETVFVPLPGELADRTARHIAEATPRRRVAEPFDAMLRHGVTDPWHLDDSVYERRRAAVILACLGRPRYLNALEIGCATGQLARQLRGRAENVTGLDASERALEVARAGTELVRWVLGAAPADIPDEEFDLIVMSEVTYFLDGPDLLSTLRAARRRLTPGGEILIANWSAQTENIPLDGPTADEQAATALDLPIRARYQDTDFTVQVWGEPISVHREFGDRT